MEHRTLQEIGKDLTDMLFKGFGGSSRPELVHRVKLLADEARRAADHHPYICEKAASMTNWVQIACSRGRHKQWGLERVEQMAHADAYRIAGCDYMISGKM